jgi:hypothetical protein
MAKSTMKDKMQSWVPATAILSSKPPKKYVQVNGVLKLNPTYKMWKEAHEGQRVTTALHPKQALPVVTNMEDHGRLCEASIAAGGDKILMA